MRPPPGPAHRVRIQSFGGLAVVPRGGHAPLHPSPRQRQLLRWLLLAPWGPPLDVNTVCDQLWPGAEGDGARSDFASAVRRLRALLNDPLAVTVRDGLVGLDPRRCRLDLEPIRRLALAELQVRSVLRARRAGRLLQAHTRGYNALMPNASGPSPLEGRVAALAAAWRTAVLRIAHVLADSQEDTALVLELFVSLDRHGLADDRVLALWVRIAGRARAT